MGDVELRANLGLREEFREQYWSRRDPLLGERLTWRAQTFRHLVHLLPGQTILELGCGSGRFTSRLAEVTRGENPITAVRFGDAAPFEAKDLESVELLDGEEVFAQLAGRQFDFIVAMDVLDQRTCSQTLQHVIERLRPGGEVVFYESNPWNPVLRLKRLLGSLFGRRDQRRLLGRYRLYELLSEIGFIRAFAVFNDFVYPMLGNWLVWPMRNLSVLLENARGLNLFAGSILLHAQRPPRSTPKPDRDLSEHESLRHAVSIVIPCHNEEANVASLVGRLFDLYGGYIHEVVLVDDNSRDSTAEVIRGLMAEEPRVRGVFRQPPNGVGRALKDGYAAATGEYVLTMDCDFYHLLPEVRDLFDAAARGHEVVVGSRFSRRSILLNYPLPKVVANRVFHFLARLVLGRRCRDLTNNLKLLRRSILNQLILNQPGFAANAETGFQPLVMGYEVTEVPISWINRAPDMGSSSFQLARVGGGYWRVLRDLLWRKLLRGGPYKDLPEAPSARR